MKFGIRKLRRFVTRRCLDILERIGIETYHVFHCAAVSSSDIFGTAVSTALYWSIAPKLYRHLFSCVKLKQLLPKYPMMTQQRIEITCIVKPNSIIKHTTVSFLR